MFHSLTCIYTAYSHPARVHSKMTSLANRGGEVTKNGDILINNSSLSHVSLSCFNENKKFVNVFVLCNRKKMKSLSFYKEVAHHVSVCGTSSRNFAEDLSIFRRIPVTNKRSRTLALFCLINSDAVALIWILFSRGVSESSKVFHWLQNVVENFNRKCAKTTRKFCVWTQI